MKSDKETKKLPIRRGTVVTVLLGLLVGTALAVSDSGTFELGDEVVQPGSADILSSDQAGPDWTDLFNADGTLKDEYPLDESGNPSGNGVPDYQELYGGEWAVFMTDDVSLGTNPETTALAGSDDLVQNATAEVDHDIGNAYVYSTFDADDNVVLFAGAERLGSGDSYLEFEFNHAHVRLGHGGFGRGEPWRIPDARAVGDLMLRLNFIGGLPSSLEAHKWVENNPGEGAFQLIDTVVGEDCNSGGTVCVVCNGGEIDGGPWPNFDELGDPEMITTDRFVELGVNAGALLGFQPDYTSIRIRTPQDIAFGYFAEGN
jgi:hypothetical protein